MNGNQSAMSRGLKDGTAARARQYYVTVESFTVPDLQQALGKLNKSLYRTVANDVAAGLLFACGRKGRGLRRYTLSKEVADRIDRECEPKPLTGTSMRRKIGACLGGLHDLDSLRLRCDVDPRDDDACWVWQGAVTSSDYPLPIAQLPDIGRSGSVLRWAFRAFRRKLKPGEVVWRSVCEEQRCCNPWHLKAGTRAEWGAWVKKMGKWSGRISYKTSAKRQANARRVVTMDVLRDIALRGETNVQAAERLGVHHSTISKARQHVHDQVSVASVFAWRPVMP